MTVKTYEPHPHADLFPLLSGAEFTALVEDVKANGLRVPIVLHGGKILDGRNRLRACQAAGVEPKYEVFEGTDEEALSLVVSLNIARRHLTTPQKAVLALNLLPMERQAAQGRMTKGRPPKEPTQTVGEVTGKGEATEVAGRRVGVSGETVRQAARIADEAPDVIEAMRDGVVSTMQEAKRLSTFSPDRRTEILTTMRVERVRLRQAEGVPEYWSRRGSSSEWYTPGYILDAARRVMGGDIDLDPASSDAAQLQVKARRHYTVADDGLSKPWEAERLFINPPYGSMSSGASAQAAWVGKLLGEYDAGRVRQAVLIARAATSARWFAPLWQHPVCLVRGRIAFEPGPGVRALTPTIDSAIVGIGVDPDAFAAEFGSMGRVVLPDEPQEDPPPDDDPTSDSQEDGEAKSPVMPKPVEVRKPGYRLLYGRDVLDALGELPDASVHVCCTSPPFWGQRDYGVQGQIGLEETPEEYVEHLVRVFTEVRRVLRPDGVVWVNLGDTYEGKELVGIPWRVALALQEDGWWLRSEVIWSKGTSGQVDIHDQVNKAAVAHGVDEVTARAIAADMDPWVGNPHPQSASDRPSRTHENIFLLAPGRKYFYDRVAVAEPALYGSGEDAVRQQRSVWLVPRPQFTGAHFATWPEALVGPMIKAGTSVAGACVSCGAPWARQVDRSTSYAGWAFQNGKSIEESAAGGKWAGKDGGGAVRSGPVVSVSTVGWAPTCECEVQQPVPCVVLDPFSGSGTTGSVAVGLGRDFIGIDLNDSYLDMARMRIEGAVEKSGK